MNAVDKYYDYLDKLETSNMLEKLSYMSVGGLDKGNGVPMSTSAPYINNSENDMALGKNFTVPAVKPFSLWDHSDVPKSSSMDLIKTQQPVLGYDNTALLLNGMSQSSDSPSGLVSTADIFKGFTRAGVGAAVGYGLANVAGTLFSLPPPMKSKLANYGAIGAAFMNSGLADPAAKKIKAWL